MSVSFQSNSVGFLINKKTTDKGLIACVIATLTIERVLKHTHLTEPSGESSGLHITEKSNGSLLKCVLQG